MAQRGLRLTEDLQRRINAAVEERGMNSAAAFIRLAIQNELDRAELSRSAGLRRWKNEWQRPFHE